MCVVHVTLQLRLFNNFITFAPRNSIHHNMKKSLFLLLPFLFMLFACQPKQEPVKTGTVPAKNNPSETFQVEDEKPVPGSGLKDVKPPSNEAKNASTLFKRGLELIKSGKYEEGIDYLTRALENEPQNARILFNRGNAYYIMKDYDKARADFNTSLRINPSDTMVLLYSGLNKYYLDDLKGSFQDYSNAIVKSKRFATAYYNRGIVRGRLNDYKGAVEDFDKAIDIKPDYSQAYYNRGLAKLYNKDTMNACSDWMQADRMGSPNAKQALDLHCKKWAQ